SPCSPLARPPHRSTLFPYTTLFRSREEMLSWPPGRRETDGVWARHWYAAVERSTTFQPYVPKPDPVPPALEGLLVRCYALYRERSEEHTSELQSRGHLVCRLLLEKK